MKKMLLYFSFLSLFSITATAQVTTTIGLIGEGTPNANWDDDTPMVQDAMDTSMWTLNVVLSDGPVKFRANGLWDRNWGNPNPADFMSGIGIQGADNMQAFAGEYNITFNHVTGAYTFEYVSDIGMIGPATSNANWDDDVNMYRDQNDPNKFFTNINLGADLVKWRKDDDWIVDWGNDNGDFPGGIATVGGGNITVGSAGFYTVTLDTMTGEYLFSGETVYDTISLIGEGVAGDWDTDFLLDKTDGNEHIWTTSITLAGGGIKFRAEKDWPTNWGGVDWPAGEAVRGSNDNIPSEAGDYDVYFNSKENEYRFWETGSVTSVGIIGTATPNGWDDPDTDLTQDASNPNLWSTRLNLVAGECKFRLNDLWENSYGAAEFPNGFGELNGNTNIPVDADGDYIVTFNSLTGEYTFKEVVEYGTIGIIGKSGPNADWDTDAAMVKDAADFNLWTLDGVALTDAVDPCSDDTGVKFRADNAWDINWGNCMDFAAGVATQASPNIPTTMGVFDVMFRSDTGEYSFTPVTSTQNVLDPAAIEIYPNPTNTLLNIDLNSVELNGTVNLSVMDMTGKKQLSQNLQATSIKLLDVSQLPIGTYMLQISSENHIIVKRFGIAR